jgi:hypothetical protein
MSGSADPANRSSPARAQWGSAAPRCVALLGNGGELDIEPGPERLDYGLPGGLTKGAALVLRIAASAS